MHFGVVTPPVPGHINPFCALGRELIRRGHRVTVFHMKDIERKVTSEGLEFCTLGTNDFPLGTLPAIVRKIGSLSGVPAMRYTVRSAAEASEMLLRDAPSAIKRERVDALLVDQTEPGGATIAEHLDLPFVTICNALALNREPSVPPPFMDWEYREGYLWRQRNGFGYKLCDMAVRPLTELVSDYRKRWGLPPYRNFGQSFSERAQISQQVAAFDFPRTTLPPTFHYTGPLRDSSPVAGSFPWERLDGQPLIYASLGTLQGSKEEVFRCFADATREMNVQLVMSHGGALGKESTASLPGSPIVVDYAPQFELLKRARLTLTHAGLNTVLDSLSHGVPLVAIPITYEQPAIAKRIQWANAGTILSLKKLTASRVRGALETVLGNPAYYEAAARVQKSIREAGGVTRAAEIIEHAV